MLPEQTLKLTGEKSFVFPQLQVHTQVGCEATSQPNLPDATSDLSGQQHNLQCSGGASFAILIALPPCPRSHVENLAEPGRLFFYSTSQNSPHPKAVQEESGSFRVEHFTTFSGNKILFVKIATQSRLHFKVQAPTFALRPPPPTCSLLLKISLFRRERMCGCTRTPGRGLRRGRISR